jgi:hypothetical protein
MDWKGNLFFGLMCAVMSVAGTGCVTGRQLWYGTAEFKDWQRTEAERRIAVMSDTNRWEGDFCTFSMEIAALDLEQNRTNTECLVISFEEEQYYKTVDGRLAEFNIAYGSDWMEFKRVRLSVCKLIAGQSWMETEKQRPPSEQTVTLLDTQGRAGDTLVWRGAPHELPAEVSAFWDMYTRRIGEGKNRQNLDGGYIRAVPAHVSPALFLSAKRLHYSVVGDEEEWAAGLWNSLVVPNYLTSLFGENRIKLKAFLKKTPKYGRRIIVRKTSFSSETRELFVIETLPVIGS